jgi:hypothetical protein
MSATRSSMAVLSVLVALVLVAPFGAADAQAQGCVASRIASPGGVVDAEGQSYYLPKGDWQASLGFRGFRSHRHFVGPVEQSQENFEAGKAERPREGSEVINHTYIPSLSLSRGMTDRLSLNADLPIFIARRKSPANFNVPLGVTDARGIGDLQIAARYWLGKPAADNKQNLAIGLGVKLPTGNDRYEDDHRATDPVTREIIYVRRPVDQSIQPGDGGFGFTVDAQGFRTFGKTTLFASASYLANPKEQNDFLRDPLNANPDPVTAYLSIADQFAARVGVGTAAGKFGLSLAARMEGVPSSDLIGGDMGRRRPGYSIAIEPGLSYSWKTSSVSVSVPYLVRRVRTQALADKLESIETGHKEIGDAAFADYVVVLGYSKRF